MTSSSSAAAGLASGSGGGAAPLPDASDRSAAAPRPRACVVNLGCRVNRVESDRITAGLAAYGIELVEEEAADAVVVNTCAVTGEAEAKTRKAVRRALALPRSPRVIVTGCVVNLNAAELTGLSPRVVAEPSKAVVPARVASSLGLDASMPLAGPHGTALRGLLGRSRLGVKIQDGCNHRCSYCIVWRARGPERSVPVDEVVARVREAEAAGVAEVVLTGVNLGAYRGERAGGASARIADLLDEILGRTGIPQVRISSIEPMDADVALVRRMAAAGPRVAPFLHLPVQSGCTGTLRRMRRPYTGEQLVELVDRIRVVLPAAALSADVIVGFPGETEDEFEASLAACERIGFSRMHVFRYSKRPGTPAAVMAGQVPPPVMARRGERMRALASRLAREDAARRVGTVERAVLEGEGRGTLGSFHRVEVAAAAGLPVGSLVDVAIMGVDDEGALSGRVLGGPVFVPSGSPARGGSGSSGAGF